MFLMPSRSIFFVAISFIFVMASCSGKDSECRFNSDCPDGMTCENGSCSIRSCNNDSDCPHDQSCIQGVCKSGDVAQYTLFGVVKDWTQDVPLPGVTLSAGGIEDTTGSNGSYQLPQLSEGSHKLTVSRSGYIERSINVALLGADKEFNIDMVPDKRYVRLTVDFAGYLNTAEEEDDDDIRCAVTRILSACDYLVDHDDYYISAGLDGTTLGIFHGIYHECSSDWSNCIGGFSTYHCLRYFGVGFENTIVLRTNFTKEFSFGGNNFEIWGCENGGETSMNVAWDVYRGTSDGERFIFHAKGSAVSDVNCVCDGCPLPASVDVDILLYTKDLPPL